MKHKILFTGGSGLLSVCWTRYISKDFDVYLALHERTIELPYATCLKVDLNSYESILQALNQIKPDFVVNSAALTNVEYCQKNHHEAFQVNTELAINTSRACEILGIKLIHISTDHIFDGNSSFYTESSSPNPLNVYGMTKLEAEIGLQSISENSLIIRTNFFDLGPTYRQSFSDWIICNLQNQEKIDLFDDVYFTPIHVQYLAQYVHALLISNNTGIYNVVGPQRLSKYQFGIQLAQMFSFDLNLIQPISIDDRPDLTKRPRDMSLSNAKIMNITKDSCSFSDHLILLFKKSI